MQDACLLAMLRLAADCEEVPSEIVGTVSKLREASGRHIKRVSIIYQALSMTVYSPVF